MIKDFESVSLCLIQFTIVEFLELITSSHHYFIICFPIAKDLDDERMKLDYLLRLAFIELKKNEWEKARDFFNGGYFVAR